MFIDGLCRDFQSILLSQASCRRSTNLRSRRLAYDRLSCRCEQLSPTIHIAVTKVLRQCRAMFFPTIKDATLFWIKGEKFSLSKLLGPTFASKVPYYENGAMGIFRLAPQDYHRFHSPVDGIMGEAAKVGEQYYTVNPQGIRSASVLPSSAISLKR